MVNADEFADLPPEERILRLKRLEAQRKKEIVEMERMITESQSELTERKRWEEKVPIPHIAQDDARGLSDEGKSVRKTLRQEKVRKKEEKECRRTGDNVQYHLPDEMPRHVIDTTYIMELSHVPLTELEQDVRGLW